MVATDPEEKRDWQSRQVLPALWATLEVQGTVLTTVAEESRK